MKVLIAGDFCPRDRVAAAFEKGDYASVLSEVRNVTAEADYSVVNFECPVETGKAKPIEKQGPNLRCTESGAKAVKYAGFDCVTLANNHFLDYGEEGVAETLTTLEAHGIDHVGGGLNLSEASQILYKDINGKCLAIINCCENEFSIATATTGGSNPLNPIQQYYAIKESRDKSDFVLVIVHGGHEHFQLPSPRMVETYRFFVDAGADAVVNHHQHCYSGYEVYHNKPIFYGLGNFCFDKPSHRSDFWNEGYMALIDFSDAVSFAIYPYKQCGSHPMVLLYSEQSGFCDRLNYLNEIISSPERLQNETKAYYEKGSKGIIMSFEPYSGRLMNRLYLMGLLPTFVVKKKKKKLLNIIMCESHRDKVLYVLEKD